jgi:hypothetical protein
MSRGRWKREHELPSFPFHCYTNPYHVAKELLVGTVQKFLQSERLRSSWRVKHSRLLKKELQNFRVKITKSANEHYGPDVREGGHDDKVLATAVGLWHAEHWTPAASVSEQDMRRLWAEEGYPRDTGWEPVWSRESRRAQWQAYVQELARRGVREGFYGREK